MSGLHKLQKGFASLDQCLLVGIVSCTERGATRRWTRHETAALRRVSHEIALRRVRRIRESAHAKLLGDDPHKLPESRLQSEGERGSASSVDQQQSTKSGTKEPANHRLVHGRRPYFGVDDPYHRTSSTDRCGSSLSTRLPRSESRAFARTFARLPSTRSISRCCAARALSASRFSRSASGVAMSPSEEGTRHFDLFRSGRLA